MMNLPFVFIEDKYAPEGTILMTALKYRAVPVGVGEPPQFKEVIDWDATAKASGVIKNFGEDKE